MNNKQRHMVDKKNREKLLKVRRDLPEYSGIYILARVENGFKYAYIGQAKNILQRLVSHLRGYQHIDLSIKKHGLYCADNPSGWAIDFVLYPEHLLDEKEQKYIQEYANMGYQLRNKTRGSQGEGKVAIDEFRPAKGYYDGVKQGYKNAVKDIAHLFEKHLQYKTKSDTPGKLQLNAIEKLETIFKGD